MNQVEFLAAEEQGEVGVKDERLSWQDRQSRRGLRRGGSKRLCKRSKQIDETFQPGGASKSTERGVRTRSHDLISL